MKKINRLFSGFVLAISLFSNVFAALPSGSRLGPTASFFADKTSVKSGEKVNVDASASQDARGSSKLDFRWDCNGDYEWTAWSSSPKYSCVIGEITSSDRYIRLQVRDSDGFIDETKTKIGIKENAAGLRPTGRFYVEPKAGDTDTNFRFTPSVVSAINTPTDQLEVRWDWEGDQVWDTDYSLSRSFFHVFGSSGVKETWMEVRDRDGTTWIERGYWMGDDVEDTDRPTKYIGRVEITTTGRPSASFRTYPTEIWPGAMVHFDASGSQNVSEYRWDYDGDGSYDTDWSKDKTTEFEYDNAATFRPRLQVRSGDGILDMTERQILVSDVPEIPPSAFFRVTNASNSNVGSEAVGALLDRMRFDASSSRDRDNSSTGLQVRWDFEGDGIWDTTFGTGKVAYHEYDKIGVFDAKLEVLDSYGNTASATSRVQIVANTPPVASLKISPLIAPPGERIRFDASGSTDDQSGRTKLKYRFDFEDDGVWDTEFLSSSTKYSIIEKVGRHTARVEVRDTANAVGQATASYEIYQPEEPVARFSVTPTVGTFATTFRFDGSNSIEPTGLGKLWYRWDFDSSGPNDINFDTSWSTSATTSRRYSTTGNKRVCLAVKNSADQQNTFCEFIEIHPDSPYLSQLSRLGVMKDENPDQLITRAEMAKMVSRVAGLYGQSPREQQFTDVPKTAWFAPFVSLVVERGWMSPKNNFAFEPNGSVNRAEATKILVSVAYPRVAENTANSSWSDLSGGEWFARFAEVAALDQLIDSSDGKFKASEPITRGQVARMLGKLVEKYGKPTKTALLVDSSASPFFASILDIFGEF